MSEVNAGGLLGDFRSPRIGSFIHSFIRAISSPPACRVCAGQCWGQQAQPWGRLLVQDMGEWETDPQILQDDDPEQTRKRLLPRGRGGDLRKLPGGVGSPRAASPPASRVFRPPPPRACREGERSRQRNLCVTKDSTFGLVQGGRGIVKNRGSLALGVGRKPHVAHRASGAGARNSSARHPLLPQSPPPQTLRSLCPRAPRIAPSSCPGKGKLGQLSWKRACEQKDF